MFTDKLLCHCIEKKGNNFLQLQHIRSNVSFINQRVSKETLKPNYYEFNVI